MINGKPIFLYENLLKQYAVTVTTEDVNYPKENLFDDQLNTLFKPTGFGALFITIDAGAAVSVDAFCLGSVHNLKTVNATVTLQYSSDNFAANIVDAFAGFIPPIDNSYQYKFFTAVSARYWRIKLSGMTSIPQIGQLAFGSRYTLPRWFMSGFDDRKLKVVGAANVSGGGQRESLTFYKGRIFPCALRFIYLNTQAEIDFFAWRDAVVEGMPFWFFWDVTGTYEVCFVCLKEREVSAPISGNRRVPSPFTLQEEL